MSTSADLLELLERRATSFGPDRPEALGRVLGKVRRRRRLRGGAASVVSVVLIAGMAVGVHQLVGPPAASPIAAARVAADPLAGTVQSLAVRQAMGIQGPTKGAPDSVLVRQRNVDGSFVLSLVEMDGGSAIALPLPPNTESASLSPKGDVVAGVAEEQLVVAPSKERATSQTVPDTSGAEGPVSWAPGGTALFARVHDGWVRVRSSDLPVQDPDRDIVESLSVPKLPGGPILLSVSPVGTQAIMFGVTTSEGDVQIPHLYVGAFDGTTVTDVHALPIPPGAIDGPMGWVGDNAFLLAPAPGRALIVRTDGSWTLVQAERMANPCSFVPRGARCVSEGPWLLGTNADGSLLFWRLAALALPHVSDMDALATLYYRTWLDGTHAVRLTGTAGKYGPPIAPK
jgi:hypothetical protein